MTNLFLTKCWRSAQVVLLFICCAFTLQAQKTYHWTGNGGGGGDWSTLQNWKVNNSTPTTIPSINDHVVFDSGDFTGNQTVTINGGATCASLDMTAVIASETVTLQVKNNTLSVAGDFKLSDQVVVSVANVNKKPFSLIGIGSSYQLSLGGKAQPLVTFEIKANATYQINEDAELGRMILQKGVLTITSGHTLKIHSFLAGSNVSKALNMAGATIEANGGDNLASWKVDNFTLSDNASSHIQLLGNGVEMEGGDGIIYNNVTFGKATTTRIVLKDKFMVNNAILNGHTIFETNGTSFKRLTINNSSNLTLSTSGQININENLRAEGTCDKPMLWTTNMGGSINFEGDLANFSVKHVMVNRVYNRSSRWPILDLEKSYNLDAPTNTSDFGWNFDPTSSRELYWTGGTTGATNNNWSNPDNWAINSVNGTPAACVPGPNDNVYFKAASFAGGNQTVNVDVRSIYCQNMTWDNSITPTFKNAHPHLERFKKHNRLFIWGSLKWGNAMNQDFVGHIHFRGKGNINSESQTLKGHVYFDATGTYTLADALSISNGSTYYVFYFGSGTLDLNRQNFTCRTFRSDSRDIRGKRTLHLRNSTVNIYHNWSVYDQHSPLDLTINKGSSTIIMHGNGDTFDGGKQDYHYIEFLKGNSSTIEQVGNVEKITVKGTDITLDATYNTSTSKIKQLIFTAGASGTFKGNGVYGQVTLDRGQVYRFQQGSTQTMDELIAPGTCSSPISLQTNVIGISATVKLGALNATSDYLYITQVNAINTTPPGGDFPVSNGFDQGAPSTGWDFNSPTSSRVLYWVGGTITGGSGNWGDQANWSLSSGGIGGECIPTPNDSVFFDAQSFNGNGPNTVRMNLSLQTAGYIKWEDNVTHNPRWEGNTPLEVYGSFTLANEDIVTNDYTGRLTFTSNGPGGNYTINVKKNQVLNDHVTIDGQSTWNLGSNLTIRKVLNTSSFLYFKQGSLNLQGNTLTVHVFRSDYTSNRTLSIANAKALVRNWNINSTHFTLDATGSEIEFVAIQQAKFIGGHGLKYHNIYFKQAKTALMEDADDLDVNSVIFNAAIQNTIRGNGHTIRAVTFHKNGEIYGSHTFGDLVLDPEPDAELHVQLESGKTQTILNNITAVGDNCVNIFLKSTTEGQEAMVSKTNGTVDVLFLSLRDINAQGGATFNVNFGVDIDNNSGWNFLNSTTAPFAGLGADFQLAPGATHTFDVTIQVPANLTGLISITYKWYKDGVSIPNAHTGKLEIDEAGTYKVVICFNNKTACVVDDEVIVTSSSCDYTLGEASVTCGGEEFCVWLEAQNDVPGGIIGMDYCLSYDPTIMEPIGNAELGAVVQSSGNHGGYHLNYQGSPGQVFASVYYNSTAPAGTYFAGKGQIICIRFRLRPGVQPQNVTLNVCQVRETYALGEVEACADAGKLSITNGAGFTKAQVIYWNQSNGVQPLAYDANNSGNYLVTQIQGTDNNCDNPSSQIVHPDVQGHFLHKNANGTKLMITRDTPGDYYNPATGIDPSDIMAVINGMDCYYAKLITTRALMDLNGPWSPNAYQMLAADVNMNGVVAASDITLMQQRTVMQIQEYPQVWNYDYSGSLTNPVPKNPVSLSYDWRFINQTTLLNQDFQIAGNYPVFNGVSNNGGFWRDDVPDLSACQPVQAGSACEVLPENMYYGVMLGDVDGNWTNSNNSNLRTTTEGELSIDLLRAVRVDDNTYKIPVRYSAAQTIQAIDFSFDYNPAQVSIQGTEKTLDSEEAQLNMRWNIHQDKKFLLTSYTMKGVNSNKTLYYIEVTTNNLQTVSFTNVKAYLNGKPSRVKVITSDKHLALDAIDAASLRVSTYPNPANKVLTITHNLRTQQIVNIRLVTLRGEKVNALAKKDKNGKVTFDISGLATGVYILQMKSENGQLITSKKVFIAR